MANLEYKRLHQMKQTLQTGLNDWYLHSRGDSERGPHRKRRDFITRLENVLAYIYSAVTVPILDALGLLVSIKLIGCKGICLLRL